MTAGYSATELEAVVKHAVSLGPFFIILIHFFYFLWQSGAMKVRCVDILRDIKGNHPGMLKNVDPFFILFICYRMNKYPVARWHEIVDLRGQKDVVGRMSLWHLLQPTLFFVSPSCWCPQANLLLFGPEGFGIMLFAQGIAGEAKATFFHYNAALSDTENKKKNCTSQQAKPHAIVKGVVFHSSQ
ncbi:ATPase family AAA domain-containing protein FIGL1-like isoform X1 [Rosa chinensis]|uniref:ATPase family AAA domain-containing protein FIGL1-like isoform X1 n=1 Tax=Rosa chinensis TaxID=74649 RepID=UPI001AD8E22E|nr:ATPase family AAA domain-containing protein FIGL1-like isoform X1 [Rosa chinensis]XP_040362757.1 ATPase family AAA domain-containing protein FIGL1-like isoform X1 [Rosa chinensis]